MNIIEQTWEKRNLDIKSFEFLIDRSDTVENCKEALSSPVHQDADYLVVRVPVGRMDIAYFFQDNGFRFAELYFHVEFRPQKLETIQDTPLLNGIYVVECNEEQLQILYENIRAGVFKTDRIAMDPYFPQDAGRRRYEGWVRDELSKGTKAYTLVHNDNNVGFFLLKQESADVWNGLLAAVYDQFSGMGYGPVMLNEYLYMAKLSGVKKIVSAVSSNNPDILNIDLKFGAKIKKMTHVFVRHSKSCQKGC